MTEVGIEVDGLLEKGATDGIELGIFELGMVVVGMLLGLEDILGADDVGIEEGALDVGEAVGSYVTDIQKILMKI